MARKSHRSARRAPSARPDAAKEPRQRAQPDARRSQPPAIPNFPLLGLSVAGMAVAGYLTYTGWTGAQAAYCEAGSGCDVVQASQWATFLDVPTAFWGLLTYAALAFIALRVARPVPQWRRAWVLGLMGFAVSVYLTAVSVFVLQATCPYCLASLGIFTGIVGVLVWQRPEAIPRFAWPRWLLQSGAVAAVVIAALHAQASSNAAAGQEDPYLRGLAIRLEESGTLFYGASWCPHCQEQKAMFGASVDRLPYVECSPGGPRTPTAAACVRAGVTQYPTWVFPDGQRVTGVLSIAELAERVGYKGPAPAEPAS